MKNLFKVLAVTLIIGMFLTACVSTDTDNMSSNTVEEDMMEDKDKDMMEDKDKDMMEDKDKDKDMMEDKDKDMMEDKDTAPTSEKMVENPAPDFTFTDFDGNSVTLADFKDEKVYVKFWASWCSICLKSLPEVDELSAMDNDFKVITVVAPGYSGEKKMEDFKTWFNEKGYENITVLFDEDGTYMKEFGIRAFPTSAYIDENGGLIKVEPGHTSNENIMKSFG